MLCALKDTLWIEDRVSKWFEISAESQSTSINKQEYGTYNNLPSSCSENMRQSWLRLVAIPGLRTQNPDFIQVKIVVEIFKILAKIVKIR